MIPENQGGQNSYGQPSSAPQPYQSAPQYPQQPSPGLPPTGQQPSIFQTTPTPKSRHALWIVSVIILLVLFIAAGSLAIWSYMKYQEANTDVSEKITAASAEAKKDQANADEEKFQQREKQPNQQFAGPDNYGRLTFDYPKTWSVYVASDTDTSGGTYQAYLNPGVVAPVTANANLFALRISIQQQDYSRALQQYQALIKNGKLTSSSVSVNGHNGTRLDGEFNTNLRGSAVLFQIRDKVVTLRTDANTFKPDFDALIQTVNFND